MKKFRISHYRKDCIGCGYCAMVAPHTWEMDPQDGLANLKKSVKKGNVHVADVDEDLYEDNKNAQDNCPVSIIRLNK